MSNWYIPVVTHDDWCLLDVGDLGKYHDPRYEGQGGELSAWQLDDQGKRVLDKVHEMLGYGRAGSEHCALCLERYGA